MAQLKDSLITGDLRVTGTIYGKATQDGAGNTITSKYVTLDTAQTISGAKTYTSAILIPSTVTAAAASQPTALSYGRLQSYGQLYLNADTDGSKTEFCVITSGRGVSSSSADGLAIGYDTLKFLGVDVVRNSGTWAINTTGNASTATKLQTARSINGTNFDGSGNITTTNWGTARNIYISDSDATNTGTAVSVNGSANATLKLPATIKASLSGNATSATKATQDSDGNQINSTYLKLAGGTMTGQIKTSFKDSVAVGSYQPTASTIPDLLTELRYSSGCMGSFSLGTAYTATAGGSIAAGWYNFVYIPHRNGGVNGAASGDNCNYGTLMLYGMTVGSQNWRIRYSSSAIAESRRIWNAGDAVAGVVRYPSASTYYAGTNPFCACGGATL